MSKTAFELSSISPEAMEEVAGIDRTCCVQRELLSLSTVLEYSSNMMMNLLYKCCVS
jgi:hypothetical protein